MPTTHSLRCTLYYLSLEADYPAGTDGIFRDMQGNVLHTGSHEFLKMAAIEGSAKLNDGRVLNVAGHAGGESRWTVVAAPFGLDAIGCPLVPLRSVAVDKSVIPLRSRIRLDETIGLPMSDGSAHDGIWYAVDVGGGIVGDRIDLFVGAGKAAMQPVYNFGIGHLKPLTTTILGTITGCP